MRRLELRKRTSASFARGEARNGVFFNQLREMRNHRYEHQIRKAPGFNLLVTAIILRTTKYLEASITDLRNNGAAIPNDIVQHVALLGWAHVGLTGVYLRNMHPMLRPDRPRPLRTLETPHKVSVRSHKPDNNLTSLLSTLSAGRSEEAEATSGDEVPCLPKAEI